MDGFELREFIRPDRNVEKEMHLESLSDRIRRLTNPKLRWTGILSYNVQATLM